VRLEQRVLPSGPTVLDMAANAAFYFGLVHALAAGKRAVEDELSFAAVRASFYDAARRGLDAEITWLDGRSYAARDLILGECLPLAWQGLREFGFPEDEIEHGLGVLETRVRSGQTGAQWQLRHLENLGGDVQRMMADYLENQRAGAPVHEWPT
jgi:gamma-glutamyl:cysteine ligase YbdK (ATP-grasp superfamily)